MNLPTMHESTAMAIEKNGTDYSVSQCSSAFQPLGSKRTVRVRPSRIFAFGSTDEHENNFPGCGISGATCRQQFVYLGMDDRRLCYNWVTNELGQLTCPLPFIRTIDRLRVQDDHLVVVRMEFFPKTIHNYMYRKNISYNFQQKLLSLNFFFLFSYLNNIFEHKLYSFNVTA